MLTCTFEATRGAAAQSVTVKPTGCGFDPHSRRRNIYLKFIFPILRSGVEAKRSVELCHSTRNASRIRQKVGKGVSYHYVPSAYPAVCGIQCEAVLFVSLDYAIVTCLILALGKSFFLFASDRTTTKIFVDFIVFHVVWQNCLHDIIILAKLHFNKMLQ